MKTIFDAKTGELLGAHMVGAEVTELIQGFVIAMQLETTEEELMHTVFPHPTLSRDDEGKRARRVRARAQCVTAVVSSPLVGEGQGGGDCRTINVGVPPAPNPSPQGGGEPAGFPS